ncbi:DegV family protein, partial [Neobacillus drentensis]
MNKLKIAWITDTTASLSQEFIEENNIHVVPLNIIINQESYKETIDITQKEFYERMKQEDSKFQTSQPGLGDFVELYTKLKENYDFGIAI